MVSWYLGLEVVAIKIIQPWLSRIQAADRGWNNLYHQICPGRGERVSPAAARGHAWLIKTRKIIVPRTLYLSRVLYLSDINLCRSSLLWLHLRVLAFINNTTTCFWLMTLMRILKRSVGSYNFVDRIGYAVVKMCEIEKSRLFKAERFPSFNPEPILVWGGGILCQGWKRVRQPVIVCISSQRFISIL